MHPQRRAADGWNMFVENASKRTGRSHEELKTELDSMMLESMKARLQREKEPVTVARLREAIAKMEGDRSLAPPPDDA
jgi:hypothetical protein